MMNVKTKFKLKLLALFIGVILFIIFIVIYLNSDSLNVEDQSGVTPIEAIDVPTQTDGDFGFEGDFQPGEIDGEEIIAVVSISDNLTPKEEEIAINNLNAEDDSVRYEVRMSVSWSNIKNPNWIPDGAHLSPMVAWSHRRGDEVFVEGGVATDGVELVAETGATNLIEGELDKLVSERSIFNYQFGKKIYAPGEDFVEIEMSSNHSFISVMSMIAPSPDWFITAHNVNLFESGEWVDRKTVPAVLFDAGTDNGDEFNSRDSDTNPRGIIVELPDAPVLAIASFEFTRIR